MSTFRRSGGVYDFMEEDSNGAWEASGRGLGKEAEVESFGFFCFLAERFAGSVSFGLRSGGCRKKNREEEKGRARGRQEKVRSFWPRRHRSLEDSWLLDFSSAALVTRRWPAP